MKTLEISKDELLSTAKKLRDDPEHKYETLIDLCGVDYLHYGLSEWQTTEATGTGFDRAVDTSGKLKEITWDKPRFAVVYHLLSYSLN